MVQRYVLDIDQDGDPKMTEDTKYGEWVEYSDYAKLEARIKELEAENRWIPISEGEPNEPGEYLFVSDDLETETGIVFDDGFKAFPFDEPTHWKRIVLP